MIIFKWRPGPAYISSCAAAAGAPAAASILVYPGQPSTHRGAPRPVSASRFPAGSPSEVPGLALHTVPGLALHTVPGLALHTACTGVLFPASARVGERASAATTSAAPGRPSHIPHPFSFPRVHPPYHPPGGAARGPLYRGSSSAALNGRDFCLDGTYHGRAWAWGSSLRPAVPSNGNGDLPRQHPARGRMG